MDSMISGVLMGTQSITQAFGRAFDDMLVKFAEIMAKMTAEYLAFKATQTGANTASGILGFGQTNPFAALSGPAGAAGGATQTASTTANTTALTALTANLTTLEAALGINTTTTATATTATAAGTVATTANTTTTASTGLMHIAAMAENTVATIANTLSTDLLKVAMAIKSFLPSFDVGSYSVPSDMIAQIHAGEMIIPTAQAAQIRSGAAGIGGGSVLAGGSGGGGSMNVTISLSAIDTQSGASFLQSNAGNIATIVAGAIRNGHTGLINAVRN
jgi:hypothetical protein